MNLPLRNFALGPVLWHSVDGAERANPEERTAWQHGVASTAALIDNNRGVYGPLLALPGVLAGVFAVPGPWYVRLLLAGLIGPWLVPTLVAAGLALCAPYVQRDEARQGVRQLRMKLESDLAAQARAHDADRKAWREAWENVNEDRERIRGLLGAAEKKNAELEAQAKRPPGWKLALAAANRTERDVLHGKIDELVRRGFALYEKLNTGPQPTETDDEGRGISFPFFPPGSKWDSVDDFNREAGELLREHDPGLMFAYADGVNAARKKMRRRERQLDAAQKKLPTAEQLRLAVERSHRRPAEDLECYVSALVEVKKEL